MPRTARKLSRSSIYHVMLRGINRQNIFEEDADRLCFLKILGGCKKLSGFRLYAFALMSNHVHLLIEPSGESLDTVFRRLGTRYAVWFNRKYERAGHLFQDRFRSENVETDVYFMTVLRYILLNPMKAGLESRPGEYRWSSYLAYEKGQGTITDTQFALDLFGSRDSLLDFLSQKSDDTDTVMDEENCDWRLRDDLAKEKMNRITQCASASAFQQLHRPLQKEYVKQLYQNGLSMGQISRLTGMPKTTVFKAVKVLDNRDTENETTVLRESDPFVYDPGDEIVW